MRLCASRRLFRDDVEMGVLACRLSRNGHDGVDFGTRVMLWRHRFPRALHQSGGSDGARCLYKFFSFVLREVVGGVD